MDTPTKEVNTNLAERYEVAFNQIHLALKKLVSTNTDRFSKLVAYGSRNNSIIRHYQDELYQYAKLRNAIVHDKIELGYYIAEPHVEVVERLEKISTILSKPNYALSIATKPVITFDFEDNLEEIVQAINIHGYSQYPIYNHGTCIGLLSARRVVQWMAQNMRSSRVEFTNVKVKDIYIEETDHPIEMVSKAANIFDVEDIFEKAHWKRHDLETIIITEHGSPDEKPLGLITPWDLIEIDYTAD